MVLLLTGRTLSVSRRISDLCDKEGWNFLSAGTYSLCLGLLMSGPSMWSNYHTDDTRHGSSEQVAYLEYLPDSLAIPYRL